MAEFEKTGIDELDAVRVSTKKETDKKCPMCGGTMDFNPATGGLRCPYCEYEQAIEALDTEETSAQEQDFDSAEQTANCDWGVEKKTVICKSCGAQSIYDALQIANECPYCGSNQVMEEKDKNSIAPGGVCVFKIDTTVASKNFHEWIRRKLFCPKAAKEKADPKSFKGVYLPYWTFDAQTFSTFTAQYGIDHEVEDSEGHTHTDTDWYSTSGTHEQFIDDQPVVATTQQNVDMLRKLEPFNTADNVKYKPEYVAGFIAERYSIGIKDAWESAKGFIKNTLTQSVSNVVKHKHNADHVDNIKLKTTYSDIKYKYLLLPIWISSFKYNDKVYQFMVNGQTGKVAGKTPISPLRVAIAVLIGIAVIAGIAYLSSLN